MHWSRSDLHQWWCRHPRKCPSLHFPILGTDSHVKHLQKVPEENLEETTPMSKILTLRQIAPNSEPSGDGLYVSRQRGVASNSHAVRVKKCAHVLTKIGTEMCTKKCAHCKDLVFDFSTCYCLWPKHERSDLPSKVPIAGIGRGQKTNEFKTITSKSYMTL